MSDPGNHCQTHPVASAPRRSAVPKAILFGSAAVGVALLLWIGISVYSVISHVDQHFDGTNSGQPKAVAEDDSLADLVVVVDNASEEHISLDIDGQAHNIPPATTREVRLQTKRDELVRLGARADGAALMPRKVRPAGGWNASAYLIGYGSDYRARLCIETTNKLGERQIQVQSCLDDPSTSGQRFLWASLDQVIDKRTHAKSRIPGLTLPGQPVLSSQRGTEHGPFAIRRATPSEPTWQQAVQWLADSEETSLYYAESEWRALALRTIVRHGPAEAFQAHIVSGLSAQDGSFRLVEASESLKYIQHDWQRELVLQWVRVRLSANPCDLLGMLVLLSPVFSNDGKAGFRLAQADELARGVMAANDHETRAAYIEVSCGGAFAFAPSMHRNTLHRAGLGSAFLGPVLPIVPFLDRYVAKKSEAALQARRQNMKSVILPKLLQLAQDDPIPELRVSAARSAVAVMSDSRWQFDQDWLSARTTELIAIAGNESDDSTRAQMQEATRLLRRD